MFGKMNHFAMIGLLMCLIGGCNRSNSQSQDQTPTERSVLDVALEPAFQKEWTLADRELPSDTWTVHQIGGRANDSRSQRLSVVVQKMLDGTKPKIGHMSALELLHSLKTEEDLRATGKGLYDAWWCGNGAILEELERRPKSEIDGLPRLEDDSRMVITAPSGEYLTMHFVVERLLNLHRN